jgi:hypothetical protein
MENQHHGVNPITVVIVNTGIPMLAYTMMNKSLMILVSASTRNLLSVALEPHKRIHALTTSQHHGTHD